MFHYHSITQGTHGELFIELLRNKIYKILLNNIIRGYFP